MAKLVVTVIGWECPGCGLRVCAIEESMNMEHEEPHCELFTENTATEYTAAVLTSLRRGNN